MKPRTFEVATPTTTRKDDQEGRPGRTTRKEEQEGGAGRRSRKEEQEGGPGNVEHEGRTGTGDQTERPGRSR